MSKMRDYEQAIRKNMARAKRDYKDDPEHLRGFKVGAVLKLWEAYQDKQIDESQLDRLINVLYGYPNRGLLREELSNEPRTNKL